MNFQESTTILKSGNLLKAPRRWEDKEVHTFPKDICPRVNLVAWLEFELAYYDSAVQLFNPYTMRTPPVKYGGWGDKRFFFIIQHVKARAIPCPHQLPTRDDNTVLIAQGGTATPGAIKQLLPPERVFKRIICIYIHQIN